ncbi:(-)-isopiperitenol/(-)-carveol dehydrogenase [Populus alba x Populus x berolinensis]|nr:(-)-isopiperitenol/(-)-carveol dehydrogenase [Populus alba x Populus x berolinensis]
MANAKPCKSKVQDKVAIVTGGASGLGEATVLAFVENGARGVVIADIQDEKGQKLAESIGTNRSTYIHCDVTDGGMKGSIICTASTLATLARDMHTDYIMSKSGVLALMKCASYQLSEHGIRVNCVSPGPVATPLACKKMNMGVEEAEKAFEPHYCLKGVLKAKHVADAVLFLASEDSEFVTGHNLVVDGGYNFQGIVKYDHGGEITNT